MASLLHITLPRLEVRRIVGEVDADTRLILSNLDPGPGEVGFPLYGSILIDILDTSPNQTGPELQATRIWVDGQLAFDGNGFTPQFLGPKSQSSQLADGLSFSVHPVEPFGSNQVVTVRVKSSLPGGEAPLERQYTFTAEDRTTPRALVAHALDPRTIRVGFDEPILSNDNATFRLTPLVAPAVTPRVIRASTTDSILELETDIPLTAGARYRLELSGISDLRGNVLQQPVRLEFFALSHPFPPNRRFDLWSMLPLYNRRNDQSGDLHRFVGCLQEVVDLMLADLDKLPELFDLERAPEEFVDAMLEDLGNPFELKPDLWTKRRLARWLLQIYARRGTARGIEEAILFFLGLDAEIEPFAADTMSLGESELGVDWILGPSSRFARYAFNVRVKKALSETQRRQIREIVNVLRPAHTHFVELLEPSLPPVFNHWELGISELGQTTILH